MSRSFRKGRHPGNLARAAQGCMCDHLSPIRNTGRVNRHLLQRLARRQTSMRSLRKRPPHIYDNEQQALCEFKHRHRLWNEPQRMRRFEREKRLCEEHTRRKCEISAGIIDWLEESLEAERWTSTRGYF